ncbi:PREDICTED: protein lifeguard 1-like [Priapulus caudatus]|uniref:Protein lifeguard 1-like n=1 Tax=Priapulus caudatus TaxID=37621 RepID=A0ABM1F2C1_PRICU|nr:PREDICTED: protein lifeguard 1-like [Priapulus caudatus]
MVISCMRRPLLDTRPESERPTITVAPTAVKSHQMEPAFEAYPPGEQHYGGDLYPHEGYAVDRYGRPYDPASYPGGPETTTTTTEYKQPYPQPGEGATYPPHGYDAPEPYSAEPTGGHHQYDYPPGEPARVRHQYDYPPGEPEEEEVAPAGEKKKKRYRKKKQEEEHDTVV